MKKRLFACILALLMLLPLSALADEDSENAVYRLVDAQGKTVTFFAGTPARGDEYIAGDNTHYRVEEVHETEKTAAVQSLGAYPMPDVSFIQDEARPVSAQKKAVALYCTHSDESYEPGDGASSLEKRGGIFDVAESLKASLEEKGITVYLSETNHYPHDAGAYRRSRATAASLAEEGVDAIFDVHRDGIPDASQYESQVGGGNVTKVRLLVGRSNQNAAANKQFAAQIKATADKLYPGLIKDIYIGKGTYNQDLMSQAVLLEFGTHKSDKKEVLASTAYMADVLSRAMYGGSTGAAGSSASKNTGGWTGILWAVGLLIAGVLVYSFLSTGSVSGAAHKWKRQFQEMTAGLRGRSEKDGRDP
ncbi:MAG: stage II sporulation protein P [Clostridia bacterium]|nr:stage II sporulation protein P [Clostridia bacterium]